MKNTVKATIILSIVTFIASFALSHIKKITQPNIDKQKKEKQAKALALVLPGFTIGDAINVKVDGAVFVYWVGEKRDKGRKIKGYAFKTSKPGYSGDVISMVGIDKSKKVLGISILKQTETPGLGARAEEISSKATFFGKMFGSGPVEDESKLRPWFQQQFSGLDLGKAIAIVKKGDWNETLSKELLPVNAVTSITGATITTRTLSESLEEGIAKLDKALALPKTKGGAK